MKLNTKGLSIVEVLIAVGIMAIVGAAMISLISSQAKETRSLQEKLGLLDFEKLLISNFADGSICSYMLSDPSYDATNPKTFDETQIGSATPPEIILTKLIGSTTGTVSDTNSLAQAGNALPGHSSLVVDRIRITDIQDQGGNNYRASIEVSFNASKMVGPSG